MPSLLVRRRGEACHLRTHALHGRKARAAWLRWAGARAACTKEDVLGLPVRGRAHLVLQQRPFGLAREAVVAASDTGPTSPRVGRRGSPWRVIRPELLQLGREIEGAVVHGRPGTVAGLANQPGSRRPYCLGRATLVGRTLLGAASSTLGRATQSGPRVAKSTARRRRVLPGRGANQPGWPYTDAGHIRTLSSYTLTRQHATHSRVI